MEDETENDRSYVLDSENWKGPLKNVDTLKTLSSTFHYDK